MRPLSAPALGFVVLACLSGIASAQTMMTFTAQLSGASEVPPVTGSGQGAATVQVNPATRQIGWAVTYSGLSGPVKAAHIHGPAGPSQNGPVMIPFTGNLQSPFKGSATLTAQQMSALEAGQTYVNLHTAQHPAGEIRGQLVPAK